MTQPATLPRPKPTAATPSKPSRTWVGPTLFAVIVVALVWAVWPVLEVMAAVWNENPQYSHGWLVPVFSGYLLWRRRAMVDGLRTGRLWLGLCLLLLGCGLFLVGGYYAFAWPERIAVVVVAAGVVLAAGGWPAMRCAWPAVAFLVFMVPLPGRLETMLAHPLQRLATLASTAVLQTLGFFAHADGTVIVMADVDLGVIEACNGLRMVVAFAALASAVALLIDRPWWQKAIVIAAALPVSLVCNIARIVVTGILHETAGREIADLVFHDLAGWLMMPAGLALIWLLLVYLDRLLPQSQAAARKGS